MELWAGMECTINRVGDRFFDQSILNGHHGRVDDIDRMREAGVQTLRYPFLWERAAPEHPDQFDWSWADERLERMQQLGIQPIAGLLHHGSGPAYTHLLDPEFPEYFARYAAAFAARYPFVQDYTPVNEPLTTARFSGLYGHWYPHGQDESTFLRALVQQCRAIVLAMQAIRSVNPTARLIQTEDMGKYWCVPGLEWSADFLNERRWLSFDLLCGRIDAQHPLWHYLLSNGIGEDQLAVFRHEPCIPDILGINYYVTSERLIDDAFTEYPPELRGDYQQHGYVDIEAVRTNIPIGLGPILHETWERYGLPLAITEAHLNCTREEQMRWFMEIWHTALACERAGMDLRAVTAWSAFGAFHWDKLLTCDGGCYESGMFDVRSAQPRPTAVAALISMLASGTEPKHPLLAAAGWWRRPERIFYDRPALENSVLPVFTARIVRAAKAGQPRRPILITGASGTLGRAFARICEIRALDYVLLSRQEMDIADPAQVAEVLERIDPWALINTAGYVRVDDAEQDMERCYRENRDAALVLAAACARRACRLLTFSSDLVFSGKKRKPYLEHDPVEPRNVYGKSKAEAETGVLERCASALVVRTSAFFGPWDKHNFAWAVLDTLGQGASFLAANDVIISPTYVPDLVNTSLDLLIDGECGIWHLANTGALSWEEFALKIAHAAGLDPSLIIGRPGKELGWIASRPTYTTLGSERAQLLPGLDHALARFLEELEMQFEHSEWAASGLLPARV